MSAKRPVASAKAKPRIAYEKSWPVQEINHQQNGSLRKQIFRQGY